MTSAAENRPECPYCGATDGLRVKCDGGGYIAPEYTCADCFKGSDTGPCFDDLPLAPQRVEPVAYRYRWKLDGEWTNWRISDASQKSAHLRDLEEQPLYAEGK